MEPMGRGAVLLSLQGQRFKAGRPRGKGFESGALASWTYTVNEAPR